MLWAQSTTEDDIRASLQKKTERQCTRTNRSDLRRGWEWGLEGRAVHNNGTKTTSKTGAYWVSQFLDCNVPSTNQSPQDEGRMEVVWNCLSQKSVSKRQIHQPPTPPTPEESKRDPGWHLCIDLFISTKIKKKKKRQRWNMLITINRAMQKMERKVEW